MKKIALTMFIFLIIDVNNLIVAQDRFNYGDVWKRWDNYTRYVFIWGFQDGGSSTHLIAGKYWLNDGDWFKEPELPKVKAVREETALLFDLEVIRDVATELYGDPANSFIPFSRMIFLARNKIRGDDIDESIREERKRSNENYLLLQEMNKQK